ncbi:alpha/beta fold hydrolase [Motiliproteus sp. MSK22-1]|uniref:alpha/beta fold hydrolase n=1 Tax=Motiliproteus sp. MSK22-1 TaxID=1897630 RepID=UPI00097592FE|nr:alpha/beta hydrolase [Motiliproteus sp. MSK22-1]OMH25702.1 alpha/beta hydrolase [Motiliproteus sp. MSK22-1]
MRTESFKALNSKGFHKIVYREWGAAENQRVLVCVHGLVRNSRDFDEIAQSLARNYRVVCPDIVGRGESDWLPEGVAYDISQYLNDMVALIARLNVKQVDWLGTSMGGLIGICLASLPGSPVRNLILNDIGPFISKESLQRIGAYVGQECRFWSHQEVEDYYRSIYPAYHGISDEQWHRLAVCGCREHPLEGFVLHYDPKIGEYARALSDQDIDLWDLWNNIQCPQMLVWGEDSDVLSADTVTAMKAAKPEMNVVSWAGVSHAPSLMVPSQIQKVVDWLRAQQMR